MNNKNRFQSILLTILVLIPVNCAAQSVENVHAEQIGDKIHIYYDLIGAPADQPVIVRVFLSTDGGKTYGETLKNVVGEVGVVLGSGKNKQIIWDVLEEVDELVSENVKFKVKADPLKSNQERQLLVPEYIVNVNANLGSKVNISSFGFDLKVAIYLKQLGLGVRGDYYKTYGEHPDYPDFGYYWGFSGGAVIEYDFIRNRKYSLYPFLYVGQTKVQYVHESLADEHYGYSIFYTPGLGLNLNIFKFIYLGVELEYCLAPRIDIIDRGSGDVADNIILDGFCFGIVLKFAIHPG